MILLAALLGLVLHEAAHTWTADLLGDPTPRLLGRVTLNPLAHLDPVGSIMLPLACVLLGLIPIGYGSSAPVNPRYLGVREYATALAAGPIANLVLAGLLFPWWPEGAVVNLVLAGFNLIPIAPLDGGRIFQTVTGR